MMNKITKWIFYVFSFLLPLSFLPERNFAAYVDKKIFLAGFVFLLFVSWLVQSVKDGKIIYPAGKTAKAVSAVAAVFSLSTLLSGIIFPSLFGTILQGGVLFGFILSFLLFFLSSTILENEKELLKTIKLFIAGASVLSLAFLSLACLALFQPTSWLGKALVFNLGVGDTGQTLALVFGGALAALFALFSFGRDRSPDKKLPAKILEATLFVISAVSLAAGIVFVNFPFVWFLVGMSLIVILFRLLAMPSSSVSRLAAFFAVIVCSLFFLFGSPKFLSYNFGLAPLPSQPLSYSIASQTLSENFKNLMVGSGLATFPYQFSLHNDGAFNQTQLSGYIFDQGPFGLLTLLTETGVLGVAAILILIGLFFWQGFKFLSSNDEDDRSGLISFIPGFYFMLLFFFYPINLGLVALAFWFLGIFAAVEKQKEVVFSQTAPAKRLALIGVLLVAAMGIVLSLYVTVQQHRAEIVYQQAMAKDNLDEAIKKVQEAAQIWQSDDYYVALSNLYVMKIQKVQSEIKDATAPLPEDQQALLKDAATQSLAAANYACKLNEKRSDNWQNLAAVYMGPVAFQDADKLAIENYGKALNLYPQNLNAVLGLANVYRLQGDTAKALEGYNKALTIVMPGAVLSGEKEPADKLIKAVIEQLQSGSTQQSGQEGTQQGELPTGQGVTDPAAENNAPTSTTPETPTSSTPEE
ncbi:MAG: hypothetical protein WC949_04440 [Candidatus Paceibacterota bacterium]|jgi:tetratricopeptide (TPR) repeat protein